MVEGTQTVNSEWVFMPSLACFTFISTSSARQLEYICCQSYEIILGQEFESVGLKTKRHWNSFTTDFFLPVENVIAELKELGKVKKKDDLAANIDLPLACHKCDLKPKNMPELKKHIATHF